MRLTNTMEGRTARIDVRVPSGTKQLVERAAEIEGKTITQFAETVLVERASAVVAQYEKTVHTRRDQERLLALLEEDQEPTVALNSAIEKYVAAGFDPLRMRKS